MNELQRTLLSIASRLLSYPNDTIRKDLQVIRDWTVPLEDEHLRQQLVKVIDSFNSVNVTQLQKLYVATFDWKEATGALTATRITFLPYGAAGSSA